MPFKIDIKDSILSNDVEVPNSIDKDAQDLISRLLCRFPLDRLGVGEAGTNSDIYNLKNHPFFKNYYWTENQEGIGSKIKEYFLHRQAEI